MTDQTKKAIENLSNNINNFQLQKTYRQCDEIENQLSDLMIPICDTGLPSGTADAKSALDFRRLVYAIVNERMEIADGQIYLYRSGEIAENCVLLLSLINK